MIPRGRKDDVVQICGEDCRYRKLYEGSQRSLTEMAARQAQAVSRVGRLRNQLVLAAKRAFPKAFGDAEREVGKRMSEVADEILVAYLEGFMGASILAEEPEGASELRQALGEIGIPIPAGVDLHEWATAVRRYGPINLVEQTQPVPVRILEEVIAKQTPVPNRDLTAASLERTTTAPLGGGSFQDLDLVDLFDDRPDTLEPADTGGFGASVAPSSTLSGGVDDVASPLDEDDDPMGPEAPGFDDVFGGESIPTGADASAVDVFFDDAPSDAGLLGGTPSSGSGQQVPLGHEQQQQPADVPSSTSPEHQTQEAGVGADLPENRPAVPSWATGRTVKPQLFPGGTIAPRGGRRERKPIRSRAIPADVPDVPLGGERLVDNTELTDDVRQRLLAATAVTRPVFISDLELVAGSDDIVSAWRDEVQEGDLSVRFVLPKPRHRGRGALVIPQASLAAANSEFAKSHWARCIESYRGARIYELGVFFHRFLEQVISFESDGEVVVVRMSLPSGLTGAVLVAGQDLGDGGATRASVCSALERLLRDRLVHVAVLVLNAEQFDGVAEVVDRESRARGWQSNMPVTLSRSWEYVDGTGTAIPLLGV